MRRYPRIKSDPAALPLFCLAPHGVFRAARIAPRAVSSYLAFSPLPALFSKNRRYHFCDTFRCRNLTKCGARVFYAACCRMVFGLSSSKSRRSGLYQRSSAITGSLALIWKPGKERRSPDRRTWPIRRLRDRCSFYFSCVLTLKTVTRHPPFICAASISLDSGCQPEGGD